MPGQKHGSGTGDHVDGGEGSCSNCPLTPVERLLNPSSPGRIGSRCPRRCTMGVNKKLWQNRKEKKEWERRLQSDDPGLEVVHPNAAGIDVGNNAHYVAV